MASRIPSPAPPYVEIEAMKSQTSGRWMFVVNLVVAPDSRQALWLGRSYEAAILVAERAALDPPFDRATPLPVCDTVAWT